MNEFIEKLIGRLENRMEYCKTCHEEFPNAKMSLTYEVQINAYKNAIEIVNQLAEEYNNDFCEWEKGSSGYVGYPAYYSRCCSTNSKGLEMQTHIISNWKYCPYCGKKIKVVE